MHVSLAAIGLEDAELSARIASNATTISANATALAALTTSAGGTKSALDEATAGFTNAAATLDEGLTTEVQRALAAEAELGNALSAEVTHTTDRVNVLVDQIIAEQQRATARHAGIRLKMKGGGPGGSRFERVGLLDPQRKEHERHFGPQKEVDFLAPPPPRRRRWWWRCCWCNCELEGDKEGSMGFPRGELASPQASLSAPHPLSLLVLLALFVVLCGSISCVVFSRFIGFVIADEMVEKV